MKYTDEEMIRMLTNDCPNAFRQVVNFIMKKLTAQTYRFVRRSGGQKIHVKEILIYALFEAHKKALKNNFKTDSDVLAYIFQIAKNNFTKIIKDDKKIHRTSIDDGKIDWSNLLQNVKDDEIADPRIKALLKALEQLKLEERELLFDYYWKALSMKEIAKKYNYKNAQNARNKKSNIIKKLRDFLNNI